MSLERGYLVISFIDAEMTVTVLSLKSKMTYKDVRMVISGQYRLA